ncbi:DUF3592 domain-containing protein [Massilia sp. CCM 9210]|uniref:DUF3592 domain-containing protein n=1 Tax=Massilia scottii TaxID=3057166 RepID=UPI0027967BA3|nr:DUF3592 domain-containing protein [Massilia sp. CCM 9210]MDQ1812119.1 DUF3592 domain-containing protein [Massilia sp. CCM 9210]
MKIERTLCKVLGYLAAIAIIAFGFALSGKWTYLHSVGRIAVIEPIQGHTVHRLRSTTTYKAVFHFTTETGAKVVRTRSFPEELLPDLEAGKPVRVIYDPDKPRDFMLEGEPPSWIAVILGGFIMLLLLWRLS